ncbi:hypothetical protein DFJ74DRAFT_662360 [Hyaloraphidium curvatum]|nr:hypothetical protein DFJ74DRAFT_662360 [Hyaloraphidium curvatum]
MNLYDDLPLTSGWARPAPDASAAGSDAAEGPPRERKQLGTSKKPAEDAAPEGAPAWTSAQNKFLSEALRRKKTVERAAGTAVARPPPVPAAAPTVIVEQKNDFALAAPALMSAAAAAQRDMGLLAAPAAQQNKRGPRGKRDPMAEEYDPAKPNSYEDIKADKRAKRADSKAKLLQDAMAQFGRKSQPATADQEPWEAPPDRGASFDTPYRDEEAPFRGKPREEEEDDEDGVPLEQQRPMASMGGPRHRDAKSDAPVIALPGEDLSGEDAFLRRGQISFQQPAQPRPPPIMPGRPPMRPPPVPGAGFPKPAGRNPAPSSVICLLNLVDPGDVDDSLEGEIAEECAKLGRVNKVLIFETSGAPADVAVRVFVHFSDRDGAAKAHGVMDGRFFGGRTVKSRFFDEARFSKLDLAPRPNEWLG